MKLMPASRARWMIRIDLSWSVSPQSPNIIAPRQSGLTLTPVRPSGRSSIAGDVSFQRVSVDDLLAEARAKLERLSPDEAREAVERDGALLIDIRADSQRAADGVVPAAHFVPRNVLEWRLDPASQHRTPELADPDAHVIVMCDEGYQSSLAAATLRQLGIRRATDLDGGFQAWRAAGHPVEPLTAE